MEQLLLTLLSILCADLFFLFNFFLKFFINVKKEKMIVFYNKKVLSVRNRSYERVRVEHRLSNFVERFFLTFGNFGI